MSDDILDQIDNALERNRRRFDPLGGEPWDEDQVERVGDGMRVRRPVDLAAGPSVDADPATVDVRRRAQDGNDPVTAAMRAEVLRQGLTDCEIDGVQQAYSGGEWHGPLCDCRGCATMITDGTRRGILVDPSLMLSNPTGNFEQDAATFRRLWVNEPVRAADQPEPDAHPVDASSDTAPDVPRKSKLSELAAALRARARRGGTR